MDAPFVYVVRFWIHPDSHDRVMKWLDTGHMAVASQPGFRWVRRVRLAKASDDGWTAHMTGSIRRRRLRPILPTPSPQDLPPSARRSNIIFARTAIGGHVDGKFP
jgi:hypothetical protein